MRTIERKTQQEACYRAEAGLPDGRRFTSTREVQVFVDGLRDTYWWRRWYPLADRVEVRLARKAKNSCAFWNRDRNCGEIHITRDQHYLRVVVHELAHCLAQHAGGQHAHDPVWARTYGELLYYIMGSDAWVTLQRGFDAEGVDYRQEKR